MYFSQDWGDVFVVLSVSEESGGTNCRRATAVLFRLVNNELQECRREKMRLGMSCSAMFLGGIGLSLTIFLSCK